MPKDSTVQVCPEQNITNKLIIRFSEMLLQTADTKKILGQIQYIHNQFHRIRT